jgi:hypothetical protein
LAAVNQFLCMFWRTLSEIRVLIFRRSFRLHSSDPTQWWHADRSCGGAAKKNPALELVTRRVTNVYGRKNRFCLKHPLGLSQEQALKDQHDFEQKLVDNFERFSQDVYEGGQNGRVMRLDRQVEESLLPAAQKVAK